MADTINDLPTDSHPLTQQDLELLNQFTEGSRLDFHTLLGELKEPLLFGGLFILLQHPFLSDLLKQTIPYANRSETSLLVVRTFIFIVLVWVVSSFN
jgi:hypothetical protein